ncbi:MAG: GxxExxY protein [Prevotella sp.]|jgi:GxxExxY protein|uniref:GxxExxY protein n=1 Tax=Hallella absiana TaxID=2925336 RepID=UPI0021C60FF6|nr:GxxExxY protein [Hallella absiana]MDD5821725.1 GxxExxY protein [Prevotella sp.]
MVNIDKYRNSIHHIIGRAFEVYNEYGGGMLESAYESALAYLLDQDGFNIERQKDYPLFYKGHKLDKTYRIDLSLNHQILLELKAVDHIKEEHRAQLFHYLRMVHMPIGLLINFSLNEGVKFEKYFYDEEKNWCKAF